MQGCSTCDQKRFAQQAQLLPSSSVKRKQGRLVRSRQIANALIDGTLSVGAVTYTVREGAAERAYWRGAQPITRRKALPKALSDS
jgi:hypothetical protein